MSIPHIIASVLMLGFVTAAFTFGDFSYNRQMYKNDVVRFIVNLLTLLVMYGLIYFLVLITQSLLQR